MNQTPFDQTFGKTVTVNATPARVWAMLTESALMRSWMAETTLDIITDWKVGSPMIIRGDWYKTGFENKGTVLQFEPERILEYSHLSSLSRLPDIPENYSVFRFVLHPNGNQTDLTITLRNFPTEVIYRHLAFYWNVAIELIKKAAEQSVITPAS